MLLQRIELQGFLSHRGRPLPEGGFEPVEIDFRSSPLWLIHGSNGAGKSALFDAITFAFFKQHRGGGQNFAQLIHDAADQAKITLNFVLNGEEYRIRTSITRQRRSAKVEGIVECWNGSNWQATLDTTNDVKDWVEQHLRMSYETFVSAVVLRQGEADAFLKASASDRRKRLMELLDLCFYEQLGDLATKRRNEWRGTYRACEEELKRQTIVTAENIESQQVIVAIAEQRVNAAQERLKCKEEELNDARTASKLASEIAEVTAQQQADAVVLEQTDIIRERARRYQELNRVLPQLDQVWDARSRAIEEEQRIAETEQQMAEVGDKLQQLQPEIERARETAKAAQEQLNRLKVLKGQLAELERIEDLESKIEAAEQELDRHQTILQQSDTITQRHTRFGALNAGLPLLESLAEAEGELAQASADLEAAQQSLEAAQRDEEQVSRYEVSRRAALQAAITMRGHSHEAREEIRRQMEPLRDRIQRREELVGEDACPVCGSNLDDEHARARLERERALWRTELHTLEARKQEFDRDFVIAEDECNKAQAGFDQAQTACTDATKKLASAQQNVKNAERGRDKAQQAVDSARHKAGAWAEELPNLQQLQDERATLQDVPQQWHTLADARSTERMYQTTTQLCRSQLATLPQWTVTEREQIRAEIVRIEATVSAAEKREEELEKRMQEAVNKRDALLQEQNSAEADLRQAHEKRADLLQRKDKAETELVGYMLRLPETWRDHSACAETSAMQALQAEQQTLADAPKSEEELHEAQRRGEHLRGQITTLQGQLHTIPPERRRAIADVENERDTAKQELASMQKACEGKRKHLIELEMQKQQYDTCIAKRDTAECELGYYNQLCEAFGKTGLQARIIRQAQESIKLYANTTLGRLSNGEWQIDLQENGNGLEILAADLRRDAPKLRQFEYISGGERFRVAVSVALAIGQAVTGGRPVDTLVIDEGFGSLDEVNRSLLVAELGRLSEEVLQGGRVIIVSHQRDVVEEFGSRYQLSRDDDGNVQIDYNPST